MSSENGIPQSWLDVRVTVQELEAETSRLRPQGDRWENFKKQIMDEDELWTFCSPPESWQSHAGREGIAIVRGGCVAAHLVMLMN